MNAEEIITLVFENLKNEFENNFTKEEIKEMKTGILNKFYKDNMNKYDYELKGYVITNAYDKLEKIYAEHNISDEDKILVFKSFYRSIYKRGMYKKDKLLIPESFNDFEYIEKKCFERDYKFIAAILLQSDNKKEIYDYLKNNIFYQMFKTEDFLRLTRIINRNKDISNDTSMYIYDSVFDDFCMRDQYFFNIEEFLEDGCDILTNNNVVSLLKHLDKYGIEKKVGENTYNKSFVIDDIVEKKQISFIKSNEELKMFSPNVFKYISVDTKGEIYIKNLLESNKNNKVKKLKDKKV